MAPRRLGAILATVALLGGAVAGCGGGDDASGDTSTGIIEGLPAETIGEAAATDGQPAAPAAAALLVVKLPKNKPLQPGDKGPAVAKLQKALKLLGYKVGTVDGEYGPKLSNAVAEFQSDHKLPNDGVAGKKTVKKLNAELKIRAEG